jgi:hypothetical protein
MFNKLNELILRRVMRRSGTKVVTAVVPGAHGFLLRVHSGAGPMPDVQVAWHEVERLLAFNQPLPVAVEPVLRIHRGTGEAIQLTQQVQGWEAFLQACEVHLPGSLPSDLWQTRLVAAQAGEPIEVFRSASAAR